MKTLIAGIALSLVALAGPALGINERAKLDGNRHPTQIAVTDDAAQEIRRVRVDPTTGALKTIASLTIPFSQTVHGTVNVIVIDVPFSQTVHGTVIAQLTIPFSQTVHGTLNSIIVDVPFSQTVHGNVVVSGVVDATLVDIPFSQTIHGDVVVSGAVNSTLVDVPFSQTIHGAVDATLVGTPDVNVAGVDFSQSVHGEVSVSKLPPEAHKVIGRVSNVHPWAGRRENLVKWSEELNRSPWAIDNVTVTVDDGKGTTGSKTLEKIIPDGTNTFHGVHQEFTGRSWEPVAVRATMKADGYNYGAIQLWDYESGIASLVYDLVNGTVVNVCSAVDQAAPDSGSIYVDSYSIYPGANDNWVCEVVFKTGENESLGLQVYAAEDATLVETPGVNMCSPIFTGNASDAVLAGEVSVQVGYWTSGPYVRTGSTSVLSGSNFIGSIDVRGGSMTLDAGTAVNVDQIRSTGGHFQDLGHVRGGSIASNKTTIVPVMLRKDTLGTASEINNTAAVFYCDSQGRLYTAPSGVTWSQTVHGNLDANLVIDFSQTVHGQVDATIVGTPDVNVAGVDFSQTVHGQVNATIIADAPLTVTTYSAGSVYEIASGKVNNANVTTATTVIAGTAGRTLSLRTLFISSKNTNEIWIQDTNGTPVIVFPRGFFGKNGGAFVGPFERGKFSATVGTALTVKATNSDAVSCTIEAYRQ